ncbi:hypothetical protein JTB14_016101 [Gonioctena quinquepunctata]|nr:hypothetical protein JTB14_016101 [Gonioctena quinquepunctata]
MIGRHNASVVLISASCHNFLALENGEMLLAGKQDEKLSELIVSSKSLSHYDAKTFKTYLPQVVAGILASLYHMSAGMSAAYSGILIPHLLRNVTNDTFDDELRATKTECSWITSVVVLIVPIAVVPTVVGWYPQQVTKCYRDYNWETLVGFAGAWGTIPAFVYVAEISRPDIRGSLSSVSTTFASIGMMLCFLKGCFFQWRTVAWMISVYSALPIVVLFFIPESPPWLVSKGKMKEAAASLEWFHKFQPHPQNKKESFAELQLELMRKEYNVKMAEQAKKGKMGAKAILNEFLKPTGYKPLLVISGLFLLQQFNGIYVTLFYSVTVFEEAGTTMDPYVTSVLLGVCRVIISCANAFLLTKFNRRPLLIFSGLGMGVTMGLSGLATHLLKTGNLNQSWIVVALILLYIVMSAIGLMPIPWALVAELFPIEIRGVANSLSFSIANLLMFLSLQSFWTMNSLLGGMAGVQWFFAVVSLMCSAYVFVVLPETQGKKLSDITEYFLHNTIYLGSSKKDASRRVAQDLYRSSIEQSEKLMTECKL